MNDHFLATPSNALAYRRRIFERNKDWTCSHHLPDFMVCIELKLNCFSLFPPLLGLMSDNMASDDEYAVVQPNGRAQQPEQRLVPPMRARSALRADDRRRESLKRPVWREISDYILTQWLILGLGVAILLAWAFPSVGKNGGAIRAEITVKWVGVGG